MSFRGFKPYVPVAARRKKAEVAAAKARKAGAQLSPIAAYRGAIAKTFWGKAWCENLEHYSDFANRLPRGRTYARNGAVIDLTVTPGEVRAQVMGSSLYAIAVTVAEVPARQWQSISTDCSGSIASLVELLQGRLSTAVMERICKPGSGLFPLPKEIRFQCSCPDWALMCKHVAAVLYGIGARLDEQPELLFSLRKVDVKDLVSHADVGLSVSSKRPARGKVLDADALGDVFGIEMADSAPPKPHKSTTSTPRKPSATTRSSKPTKATKATKTTKTTKTTRVAKVAKVAKATKATKATTKKSSAKPSIKRVISNTATAPVGKAGKPTRSTKAPKATIVVKPALVRTAKG